MTNYMCMYDVTQECVIETTSSWSLQSHTAVAVDINSTLNILKHLDNNNQPE